MNAAPKPPPVPAGPSRSGRAKPRPPLRRGGKQHAGSQGCCAPRNAQARRTPAQRQRRCGRRKVTQHHPCE
ncbi:hypothetical protein KCH_70570 [Kitasatospora cheerisanensis KCTC 2395]|uniref:Uncharacterized protein n=1 Tax=Kitasatospora cheerisanensis KCTC 2395 TaxID=1348663 RepID=A0A066YI97_9ACTN|nr:hypothetical protein KCH_70570 [Kitasatospora cheerisanensis KCTC 2395]